MTQVSLFEFGQDLPMFATSNVADALAAYREWIRLHPKDKAGAKNLAEYHLQSDRDYAEFGEAIK